jgi:hypothetical protein
MVPPGVPPYLQSLSKEHRIIHKKERFPRDTPDDVWIYDLADDGHWNIVTTDLGIGSVAHIAEALSKAGHTAFFLTKGWANMPMQGHFVVVSEGVVAHRRSGVEACPPRILVQGWPDESQTEIVFEVTGKLHHTVLRTMRL